MIANLNKKVKKYSTGLNIKRTLNLIWNVSRKWTIYTLILIVLEGVFILISVYAFKNLINLVSSPDLNNPETLQLLIKYFVAVTIFTVLYTAIRAVSTYTNEVQAVKVSEYMDDKIHACADRLDLAFYESPNYFDTLKRARESGPERPNAVVMNIVNMAKSLMMLAAISFVIISISWFLIPLLILFILPSLLVRINLAGKLYDLKRSQTQTERKSGYLSSLITSDTSAKEIKSLNLGTFLRIAYLGLRKDIISQRLKISLKSTSSDIVTSAIATIGLFACIGYIIYGTVKGQNSIGDVTVFLVVFPQTFGVLQQLSSGISQMYMNNIYVTNIFELFDLQTSLKEPDEPLQIPQSENIDFELRNVSFNYPHSDKAALKNISLKIPSGKIIAVVGFNGAGKTTLIKLLNRLYDPDSGQILVNGKDIKAYESSDYRQLVSTVFQDFGKYNVSASDNIHFGYINKERSEDEIVDAAKKSGAHEYIKTFPKQYQTMMGRLFEDGQEVSIGQWQKLAIARSFYSSSKLIILDEATSALDALAEQELFDSFKLNIGHRSALIISHRLSAIKYADYIYVISDGTVKQAGTHEELLEMEGDYARLFRKSSLEA